MKKKKKKFKIRYVLAIFLVIYVGTVLFNQYKMTNSLMLQIKTKEQEIEKIEKEITELQSKIEHSNSLEYIERIAREELKMIKPSEIIFIDKNKSKDKFTR